MKPVIINYAVLRKAMQDQVGVFTAESDKIMIPALEKEKQDLAETIEDHPVSVSLRDKNNDPLYGLIGFQAGTSPVSDFTYVMEKEIKIPKTASTANVKRGAIEINYEVGVPDHTDLEKYEILKVEWENGDLGSNWVTAIERGIPGFTKFLRALKRPMGRSLRGIQIKGQTNDKDYPARKYFTDIILKFRNNILKFGRGGIEKSLRTGRRFFGLKTASGRFAPRK